MTGRWRRTGGDGDEPGARLLNVEGYPVVAIDPTTLAVALDGSLLAEQYGVRVSPAAKHDVPIKAMRWVGRPEPRSR